LKRLEQVEGSLSTPGGDVFPVTLTLTVAELHGVMGIKSVEVARVELASRVPDGTYMLDYFYMEPFHGPVDVKHGAIVFA
jgi:hypothetical protein